MPIGPYTDGIYTDAAFAQAVSVPTPIPAPAPVPTGVGTAASGTSMSGTSVTSSGSLVSFFPPVTDWFSPLDQTPAMQTPATQATASHPCQSGGDCGCGGTCKGYQSSVRQSATPQAQNGGLTPSHAEMATKISTIARDVRKQLGEYRWNAQVLKTTPGSSTITTAIMPSGDYLSSVATVDLQRNISLVVSELRSNRTIINLYLQWNNNGWTTTAVSDSKIVAIIPPTTSLDGLATLALSAAIVARNTEVKYAANMTTDTVDDTCPDEIEPSGQSDCIIHDLVCTSPTAVGLGPIFTSDQKHIIFSAPCIQSYTVDISSCCFAHDIAIWCSHNLADISAANFDVTQCVIGHVIAGAWTAMAQDDFNFFKAIGCGIAIGLWELITGVISEALSPVFDAIYDYLLPANTPACFFNFFGDHDNSCLCGGTMPTTQCTSSNQWTGYDSCDDICKIAAAAGVTTPAGNPISEDCYNCSWQCVFQNGKPLPNKTFDEGPLDSNGNPLQTCCPGTGQYSTDSNGNPCPAVAQSSNAPCPTCEPCNWTCKSPDGGTTWDWYTDPPANGLPCCNGIPTDQVCCNWICQTDNPATIIAGKIFTDEWGDATLQYEPPVGYSCGPVNQQDIYDFSPCVLPTGVFVTNYGN